MELKEKKTEGKGDLDKLDEYATLIIPSANGSEVSIGTPGEDSSEIVRNTDMHKWG